MIRSGLFLGLLCLLLGGCGRNAKYEEIELGYRGPARTDPFLAANRLLERLGHATHTSRRLAECIEHPGTVVTPLQSFHTRGESDDVLRWVQGGGHFVLLVAGGESWRSDWGESDLADVFKVLQKRDEPEQARLLKTLGIAEVSKSKAESGEVKFGARKLMCNFAGGMKFESLPTNISIRAGEKEKPALVSYRLGTGRVTLLAHAEPWRNRALSAADHAEVFASIINLGARGDVWFLNGVRISFWRMLWDRAWLAICALVLLLIVWLARHLRRLGPVGLLKTESARDFSDHLLLTGAFLWRHREAGVLVRPVQNAVISTARRRGWHESDAEFFTYIETHTGLSPERARKAISGSAPADPHAFRVMMQDLKQMLDALGG